MVADEPVSPRWSTYYNAAHVDAHARDRPAAVVDRRVGSADVAGTSVLHAVDRSLGRARLRPVRGRPMPPVLRRGHGPPECGAGTVFPAVARRILRRDRR